MAANFLDFMANIGTTPTPVQGTSAADVARRKAAAEAVESFKLSPSSPIHFLGRSNAMAGGTDFHLPAFAGGGATRPVSSTRVGALNPSTAKQNQFGQAMTYFPESGSRTASQLMAHVGSPAGVDARLAGSNPQVLEAIMGRGQPAPDSPPAYAPWGAHSRAMAFNAFNPDPPPPQAPPPPVGADPGMGGAMIGNGRMASSIPPQQPPADGSSPLPVWREDPQTAVLTQISRGLSGTAKNGYVYEDGRKVGLADWAKGLTPAQQYAMANARGQIAATDPARKVGLTPVQQIQQSTGVSAATAYDQANAAARAAAQAKARVQSSASSSSARDGSWATGATSGSPFW